VQVLRNTFMMQRFVHKLWILYLLSPLVTVRKKKQTKAVIGLNSPVSTEGCLLLAARPFLPRAIPLDV